MAIPDYQTLMRPLLAFAGDGTEKNIRDAFDALSAEFNLTPEERHELQPSGKQGIFENRVHWARTYLDKAVAMRRTRRSHFQITDRGKQLLRDYPKRIGWDVLRQFEEFQAFQSAKASPKQAAEGTFEPPAAAVVVASDAVTPEEAIQQAETQIADSLKQELLQRIGDLSPTFFEQLVVDLIVAMGYGGSRSDVTETFARRTKQSGDEGIDGIVNEDPLGLDVVYIQAKRYAEGNTIGRERIQQFIGALVGQGANRGVFFTTSSFTRNAVEYAQKVPQKVILIDGAELARLMLQYGVGVRTERSVQIMRLDESYFGIAED